ncbi:MAG: M20/M25/M40 family metallo-hydrolase [Pseudomonadota bacterium]
MRYLALLALLAFASTAHSQTTADYDEPWQRYAYELLRDSIAFKTVRGEDQVVPFAEFLANKFVDAGFAADDVKLLPIRSDGEPSAALVVRYRGSSDKKPILFAAHMDVVPASGTGWEFDPFVLNEKDGFYFGRGVLDDKFGTTILVTTFARLKQRGYIPERDLVVAFTGDEETRQETANALVNEYRDLIDAEVVINLDVGASILNEDYEPVASLIQFSEKTYATYTITALNAGGHSSRPRPDNAIYDLADAITALRRYQFPIRVNEGTLAYLETMADQVDGELSDALRQFVADPYNELAADVLSRNAEFVGVIRTTCVPTLLDGGHVENALPESATVTVQCRIFPGITADVVEDQIRDVIDNAELQIARTWDPIIVPATPIREDVFAIAQITTDEFFPGVPVVPYPASYVTDNLVFRNAGMTAYGFLGLFMKPEDQFQHANGERIPIDGFYAALDFWLSYMPRMSSL